MTDQMIDTAWNLVKCGIDDVEGGSGRRAFCTVDSLRSLLVVLFSPQGQVTDGLKSDKTFMKRLLESNPKLLKLVGPVLKGDMELALTAISHSDGVLAYFTLVSSFLMEQKNSFLYVDFHFGPKSLELSAKNCALTMLWSDWSCQLSAAAAMIHCD